MNTTNNIFDGCTLIPFAVLTWDDGLDYDEEGNAWQDSPPCEYVWSAHRSLAAAEASLAKMEKISKNSYWLVENYMCRDYEVEDPAKWS